MRDSHDARCAGQAGLEDVHVLPADGICRLGKLKQCKQMELRPIMHGRERGRTRARPPRCALRRPGRP